MLAAGAGLARVDRWLARAIQSGGAYCGLTRFQTGNKCPSNWGQRAECMPNKINGPGGARDSSSSSHLLRARVRATGRGIMVVHEATTHSSLPTLSLQCVAARGEGGSNRIEARAPGASSAASSQPRKCGELKHHTTRQGGGGGGDPRCSPHAPVDLCSSS
jgi:hypothetical protein